MRECATCGRCFDDAVVVCPNDNSPSTQRFSGAPVLNHRYRLHHLLGKSSLGRVYLAQDENLVEREVAIRIFERGTIPLGVWDRLTAKLASVQSENVVEVTDFGTGPDDSYFIVMNRMTCETVHALVKRAGRIQLPRAIVLLRQIVSGVVAIQEKGLLHGAVNPNNVFMEIRLTTLGGFTEEVIVKVSDFGWDDLRNLDARQDSLGAQETSREFGVTEFLAPEQVQPNAPVDVRADVYGLGALAFFMLSGEPPFNGDIMQVVVQKAMDNPRPLGTICRELPPDVVRVVMKALRRDPSERHQSVSDWIAEFDTAVELSLDATGPDPAPVFMVEAPAGSTIYLDDERQGDVDSGGAFSLLLVQPGVHLVRVRYPNGSEDERLVEFQGAAEERSIRIRFEPVEAGSGSAEPDQPRPFEVVSDGQFVDRANEASDPSYERERNMSNNEQGAAAAPNETEKSVTGENERPAGGESRADCPKCGASNRATSKFCRICGASTKSKPVVAPETETEAPAPSEPTPAALPEPMVQSAPVPAPTPVPLPPPPTEALPLGATTEPSDEIEDARRQLEAEEERLRSLSEAHLQQTDEPAISHEEVEEEFPTVVQASASSLGMNLAPANQGPTEELERPVPAPAVAAEPLVAPVRSGLPETMGGAGGMKLDVPEPVAIAPPQVYRSPGRPKTIESAGTSFDSQLSDAAKVSAAASGTAEGRSQSYYLGIGAILGAIILAILGLIAFVVYWFVLSK